MSASSSQEDQKAHRYKVWLLANGKPEEQRRKAENQTFQRSKSQVSKLSDLETLLLMYNYGHPMEIAVDSRCTPPDGRTTPCRTAKLSSEAVDFLYGPSSLEDAPPRMPLGSVVSLEMDRVGAFKGVLTSQNEAGFQVAIKKDSQKALGTRLAHIAVERGMGVDATGAIKPGVPRLEPTRKDCSFTDQTGKLRSGTIVNVSQFDALIRASAGAIPPVGSRIVLRGEEWHGADVLSAFEIGFIVRFSVPIPIEKFSRALRFTDS